ncbi:ATP-dependent DNA/RNA helicase DHX36-like [Anopheles darlingi]|uniref:ATP-dependent DNA/RNA helicase DHX36-like n=1 Tax=Anopheles darlingi TaxID=43151 RepID=UPI0021002066|nr:ATP-dependent DNA/RNA helicase DHX36-like [Anopheles darlingi]
MRNYSSLSLIERYAYKLSGRWPWFGRTGIYRGHGDFVFLECVTYDLLLGIAIANDISKIRGDWQVSKLQPKKSLEDFLKLEECRSKFDDNYVTQIYNTADEMLRRESLRRVKAIIPAPQLDRRLFAETHRLESSTHRLSEFRRKLPAFALRAELLGKMKENRVILVKGETGSGKTTQIPQYILEEASARGKGSSCRIICTQPRRISAISLAKRVAKERGEPMGQSIGYQVRLDSVKPRKQGGSILFCTTGVVLAFMQSDPLLREYSHLVLDEIHDRDVNTDLLVAIVRMVLPFRKDLRVVLMSATLTAETFSAYFDGCPIVQISGVTFPVREYYLEDVLKELKFYQFDTHQIPIAMDIEYREMLSRYIAEIRYNYPLEVIYALRRPESECKQHTLLVELLRHISCSQPDGAILVFLPSVEQITLIRQKIYKHPLLSEIDLVVHVLYSKLSGEEQRQAFVKPPLGTRKIILATNIAETSITIDDVVYVINTGRHVVNVMTANGLELKDEWISKSNEVQRKGRAGRVQEGICYHLYSRARMRTFKENVPPEILRIALEEVILQIKLLRLGELRSFMDRLMDKPTDEVIKAALKLLNRLNAIDDNQHLTLLGSHLAQLRMHPTVGKMVLLASFFGCIDPITSIAASLSFKDAFCKPTNTDLEESEIRNRKWFADYTGSDHIMLANVITKWRSHWNRRWFCKRNALNSITLHQLCNDKDLVVRQLYKNGFKCDLETYRLIEDLRQGFNDLLTRKLTIPSPIDWFSEDGALLRAIIELLSYNFEATGAKKHRNS